MGQSGPFSVRLRFFNRLIAFLDRGNMCCGVVDDRLMVRVGPDAYDRSLQRPHAREMDFTGRPMRGFIFVDADGCKTQRSIAAWVKRGLQFTGTLPAK